MTNKSRRLGERRKATTGGCWKTLLQRLELGVQQIEMFFDDVRDVRE